MQGDNLNLSDDINLKNSRNKDQEQPALDELTIQGMFEAMGLGTPEERKTFTQMAEQPWAQPEVEENFFIRISTHSRIEPENQHA